MTGMNPFTLAVRSCLWLLSVAASATLFAQPPLQLQGLFPLTLDHRPYQSPVKSQASRGTCTAFSVAAMMETLDGVPADLSEQGAYRFLKLQELGKGDVGAGGLLADYPELLTRAGFMHRASRPTTRSPACGARTTASSRGTWRRARRASPTW